MIYELTSDLPPRIGLIVLEQDETLERDMRALIPCDVEVLVSRVPSGLTVTPETLQQMEKSLTGSAALFPRAVEFAAIGYGCTSGTAQIGSVRVAALLQDGARTDHVTEPVSALIAACGAMKLQRVAVVSPYVPSVTDGLCAVLEQSGVTVTEQVSFNEAEEAKVVRIAPQSVVEAALQLDPDCDAIFLSCTNLRTLDVIEQIEAETGKPVLSSNLVLAWHLLQLCKVQPVADAPGRLWGVDLP